jgi:pimeloyl-ACP methyl ester carboxylesterase
MSPDGVYHEVSGRAIIVEWRSLMIHTDSGYQTVAGGSIYYEAAGAGAPLVLSHAGFVDSRMWDDQWSDFARQHHVIRFDLRGFGQSALGATPIERRRDLDQLLQRLDVPRAILLGCSLSGEIVLDFALEQPDRVTALVLVSAVPSGFEMQGEPPALLFEMLGAIEQGDLARASELQNRLWIDGAFRQPEQVNALVRQRAAEMNRIALANGTWFKAERQPANPLNPPAIQRLGEIRVPTLIIAGALDHPEVLRAADVMQAAISHAEKIIIPDAAHLPNMEQPAMFNQIVLDFLRRNAQSLA